MYYKSGFLLGRKIMLIPYNELIELYQRINSKEEKSLRDFVNLDMITEELHTRE